MLIPEFSKFKFLIKNFSIFISNFFDAYRNWTMKDVIPEDDLGSFLFYFIKTVRSLDKYDHKNHIWNRYIMQKKKKKNYDPIFSY